MTELEQKLYYALTAAVRRLEKYNAVDDYKQVYSLMDTAAVKLLKWQRTQARPMRLAGPDEWKDGYVSDDGWTLKHAFGKQFNPDWSGAWQLFDPDGNCVDFHWSRIVVCNRNNFKRVG